MGKCFLFLLLRGMSPVSARLALPPALAHPLGARHMFFFGSRQLVVAQVVSLFSSIILERSFPTRRRFFFLLLLQTGDGRRRTVEKLKKERKKKKKNPRTPTSTASLSHRCRQLSVSLVEFCCRFSFSFGWALFNLLPLVFIIWLRRLANKPLPSRAKSFVCKYLSNKRSIPLRIS